MKLTIAVIVALLASTDAHKLRAKDDDDVSSAKAHWAQMQANMDAAVAEADAKRDV